MMFCQVGISVSDVSQAGEVRREAARLADFAGLNENDRGKASIIATELATNIARYAKGGEVLLRSFSLAGTAGLEILAVDSGPGMASVARCLQDGYSTGGTAGTGLGAVQRLATVFDIFSTAAKGTVILARIESLARPAVVPSGFHWGVVNRPAPREIVSGDTWRIVSSNQDFALMVVDGLGHGVQAAEAAQAAAEVFESHAFAAPTEFFTLADQRMRGTRGGALAVAQISAASRVMKFSGVGNVAGILRTGMPPKGRGLVSQNGTVGVEMRKVQSFDYDMPGNPLVILHSDGLQSRWSLDDYPGLLDRHPALMAGVLYRDFRRGNDDVTVCIVRCFPSTVA